MTPHRSLLALFVLTLGLLIAAACGGDGDKGFQPGSLTDPSTVATATPLPERPEPTLLPDALTPTGGGIPQDGTPTPDVDVTPVTQFVVSSEEETNRRAAPSTDAAVVGTIKAGQEATVTGKVSGEAVEGDNDVWYLLDDGSFVYSGAVTKVE